MSNKLATIKSQLEETRPSFDEMNMNNISFSREMEWAIQAFQANDFLTKMEPNTIRNCLVNVALTGLTLNPVMKQAYLVPRKGKLCVDPSYQGLIKIITDTGSVISIKAKPVFENEPFDIEQGSGGFVKHGICKDGRKGKRIGAYSIAVLNDGSEHVEWMYEEQLMGIRARSESVKAGKQSPWDSDEDEMVRKTVVKRHWKYLPKSDRAIMAANAIAFDDDNNGIDFKKEAEERQKAKPSNVVSLDTLDPESEEDIAGWNKIKALFESDVLPETLNDGSIDVLAKAEELTGDFLEGVLTKELANKWYQYIKAQVDHFTANPVAKEEEAEQSTESEANEDF